MPNPNYGDAGVYSLGEPLLQQDPKSGTGYLGIPETDIRAKTGGASLSGDAAAASKYLKSSPPAASAATAAPPSAPKAPPRAQAGAARVDYDELLRQGQEMQRQLESQIAAPHQPAVQAPPEQVARPDQIQSLYQQAADMRGSIEAAQRAPLAVQPALDRDQAYPDIDPNRYAAASYLRGGR